MAVIKLGNKQSDERRLVILKRLQPFGSMNMLELGFNATPQAIRCLAASGLVKVTVAMTPRGVELLAKLELKAQRRAMKALKAARAITQEEAA